MTSADFLHAIVAATCVIVAESRSWSHGENLLKDRLVLNHSSRKIICKWEDFSNDYDSVDH